MNNKEFENMNNVYKNILSSWIKCKDRHIFIENLSNTTLKMDRYLEIGNIRENVEFTNPKSYTLFLDNCNNMEIKITEKINHVVIFGCDNINIFISRGLISGIDVMRSKNIECDTKKSNINFLSCSNSYSCMFHLDETVENILMTTTDSYKITFNIDKEYETCLTIFPVNTYYMVDKGIIKWFNSYGSGNL